MCNGRIVAVVLSGFNLYRILATYAGGRHRARLPTAERRKTGDLQTPVLFSFVPAAFHQSSPVRLHPAFRLLSDLIDVDCASGSSPSSILPRLSSTIFRHSGRTAMSSTGEHIAHRCLDPDIYGNNSRYMNHSSLQSDFSGCPP